MKLSTASLTEGSHNTHAATLSIARSKIAASDIETLEHIALQLENGLHQKLLNQADARHLLRKVRREIVERHFQ